MKPIEKRTALHDLVADCVVRYPERECIVFDSGKDETMKQQKVTYSQLWQGVMQLKSAFENLSLQNQIIGVQLADGPSVPSVLIGLLSSSCAFYPFNLEGLQYTATTLIKVGVSWILTHSELTQKLSPLLKQLEGLHVPSDTLSTNGLQLFQIKHSSIPDLSPVKHCDLAYCITTSGTTSAPKVVHVPHSCIVPNITDLRNILQFDVNDKVLLTSPLTFDPSIIDIFCTLSSGACLVIVPSEIKRKPETLLNILHNRQAITVMQATPTLVRSFSPSKLKRTLLGPTSSLRLLALGGEKFPSWDNLRSWLHEDNNKTQFYNLYGITEVSCWASCQYIDVRTIGQDEPVPVGVALDQTLIKLVPVDGEREFIDIEDDGDIWIGSQSRICFIDNEVQENCQKTCHTSVEEQPKVLWRNTGDRGKLLSDGSIICLGRRDDQVKRNGKRMNLDAVEMVCKEVTGVVDCCAVLDQSNLMIFIIMESSIGHGLKESFEDMLTSLEGVNNMLSLCSNDNSSQSLHTQDTSWINLQQKLKAHIEDSLPSHYVPSTFVKINGTLPRTQHNKLDKKLLARIGNAEMKLRVGIEISSIWSYSQELWKNFLLDASVTINSSDNFISLGGDSLAALSVINTLEHVFKCSLPNLLDLLINKDFECFIQELQKYVDPKSSGLSSSTSLGLADNINDTLDIQDNLAQSVGVEMYQNQRTISENKHCVHMSTSSTQKKSVYSEKSEENLNSFHLKSRTKKLKLTSLIGHEENNFSDEHNDLTCVSLSVQHHQRSKCQHSDTSSNKGIGNFIGNSILSTDLHNLTEKRVFTSRIKRIASRGKMWQNQDFDQMYCGKICELTNINVSKKCQGDVKLDLLDANVRSFREHSSYILSAALDVKFRWKFDTKKCVDASPLIVEQDGMILTFIGSHSGQFSAINTVNGNSVWSVTLPDRIESSACCSLCGAYIIVGCYDGIIYVIDITSGIIIWRFATGDTVKCSPMVDDDRGYIVCGSHDGFLYCLDLTVKECVWRCHMGGGSVFSSPAIDVSSRLVYAASLAGQMMCINIDSGTVKWTLNLQKPIFSSLCLLRHSVLAACVGGNLHCISSSGHIEWTFRTKAPIFSSPIIQNSSAILIGCHDHHLYCLNKDGLLMWSFQASSPVYVTPFASMFVKNVESNMVSCSDSQNRINSPIKKQPAHLTELMCSIVITVSTTGIIYLLNFEDGHLLKQVNLPGEVFSSPVVVENLIVVGCRDNFVYCWEINDLDKKIK